MIRAPLPRARIVERLTPKSVRKAGAEPPTDRPRQSVRSRRLRAGAFPEVRQSVGVRQVDWPYTSNCSSRTRHLNQPNVRP